MVWLLSGLCAGVFMLVYRLMASPVLVYLSGSTRVDPACVLAYPGWYKSRAQLVCWCTLDGTRAEYSPCAGVPWVVQEQSPARVLVYPGWYKCRAQPACRCTLGGTRVEPSPRAGVSLMYKSRVQPVRWCTLDGTRVSPAHVLRCQCNT